MFEILKGKGSRLNVTEEVASDVEVERLQCSVQ